MRVGGGGLVEPHGLLGRAERAQRGREVGRLAHVGELLEPMAHVVGRACGRRHRATGGPRAGTIANESGSGVCCTSEPRMLKAPGDRVRVGHHQRVGLELAELGADARSLSSAVSPAKRRSCSLIGPSGGAGRSVQMRRPDRARSGRARRRPRRRPWRASRRRRRYAATGRSRCGRSAVRFCSIQRSGGVSTRCSMVNSERSTCSRACKV